MVLAAQKVVRVLAVLVVLVAEEMLPIPEELAGKVLAHNLRVKEAAVAVAVLRVTLVTVVTAVTAARAILLVHLALVVAQGAVVDRSLSGEAQVAV